MLKLGGVVKDNLTHQYFHCSRERYLKRRDAARLAVWWDQCGRWSTWPMKCICHLHKSPQWNLFHATPAILGLKSGNIFRKRGKTKGMKRFTEILPEHKKVPSSQLRIPLAWLDDRELARANELCDTWLQTGYLIYITCTNERICLILKSTSSKFLKKIKDIYSSHVSFFLVFKQIHENKIRRMAICQAILWIAIKTHVKQCFHLSYQTNRA